MNALRAPLTALTAGEEMCVHFSVSSVIFLLFIVFLLDRADAFIDGY